MTHSGGTQHYAAFLNEVLTSCDFGGLQNVPPGGFDLASGIDTVTMERNFCKALPKRSCCEGSQDRIPAIATHSVSFSRGGGGRQQADEIPCKMTATERLHQMDGLRGVAMLFVFMGYFGTLWTDLVHPKGGAELFLRLVNADATLEAVSSCCFRPSSRTVP